MTTITSIHEISANTTHESGAPVSDDQASAPHVQIVVHNDDDTPQEFVIELLHAVFKTPVAEAVRLTQTIGARGQASCGIYPRDIANQLLGAARERIPVSGHPLLITSEVVTESLAMAHGRCKLCDAWCDKNRLSLRGVITLICDDCMQETLRNLPDIVSKKPFDHACDALVWHFAGVARDQLVATSRQFPGHMRADVQIAVDRLFSDSAIRFFGIYEQHRYETLTIAT